MTLPYGFNVMQNPYSHRIPSAVLGEIINDAVRSVSDSIEQKLAALEYRKDSMGFCMLDRTAPIWRPSPECILFTAWVGPNGADYIVNGVAKAFTIRDQGVDNRRLLDCSPLNISDGAFRWGGGVEIDRDDETFFGSIAGGSGLTEEQDAIETTRLVKTVNFELVQRLNEWGENNPQGSWFCIQNLPGAYYTDALAALVPLVTKVNHGTDN